MARTFVQPGDLTGLLAEHRPGRTLADLARLTGGTKKGAYRLTLDDGATVILYVWNGDENYWPAGGDPVDDPFADASGPDLFRASHAALVAAGARVPRIHASGRRSLGEFALVEDLPGGSLEAMMERDPAGAPLAALGASIRAMHAYRAPGADPRFGKVAFVERGTARRDTTPEDVVVARARRHVAAVAARDARIAAAAGEIDALLASRRAAVEPRREYGLVHGELGPDHAFLDVHGEPVLIDFEGLTYFDVEWEHAFLRMRFADRYADLGLPAVDEARVGLYALAQSISLIEGPLRIADTDFPERDWMLDLAEWNIGQVLALVS